MKKAGFRNLTRNLRRRECLSRCAGFDGLCGLFCLLGFQKGTFFFDPRAFDEHLKAEQDGDRQNDGEYQIALIHNLASVSIGYRIVSLSAPGVTAGNTPQR